MLQNICLIYFLTSKSRHDKPFRRTIAKPKKLGYKNGRGMTTAVLVTGSS